MLWTSTVVSSLDFRYMNTHEAPQIQENNCSYLQSFINESILKNATKFSATLDHNFTIHVDLLDHSRRAELGDIVKKFIQWVSLPATLSRVLHN